MFLHSQRCRIYCCPLCQCHTLVSGCFQKYKEFEKSVRVEEIDGVKLVKNLAVKMEEVFRKKAEATRVSETLNMFEKSILFYLRGKGTVHKLLEGCGGMRREHQKMEKGLFFFFFC